MSALKTFAVAALLSLGLAGTAAARNDVFTIKLESPVAEQTRVITQNTVWTCEGDTCLARPDHAATVRACRHFVREVGVRVTAYGPQGGELTADELDRCNQYAPQTQQAQN